jgi:hypothetical protein
MTPIKTGVETDSIGKVSSLSFHPYRELQNPSTYVSGLQFEGALVLESK